MNPKARGRIAALSTLFALAACGGGGGSDGGGSSPPPPPPPASAEGAYGGTLTGSNYNAFQMVVLENDEFWSIYGNQQGNTLFLAGFMHGTGSSNAGTYTSNSAKDYSLNAVLNASVSATYVAGTSAQGSITYAGIGTVNFNGTTAAVEPYDYDQAADAAGIVGNWTLTGLDGSTGTAAIASNGAFTTSSNGCNSSGTAVPRASGKNVFDLTVQTGPAPCVFPNTTQTGIGIYSPIANSALHQLIVATVSGDGSQASLAFGSR